MHNNHKVHAQVQALEEGECGKEPLLFPFPNTGHMAPAMYCISTSSWTYRIPGVHIYYATAKRAQKVEPCSYITTASARYEELCVLHYHHYPQKQHRTNAEQEKAGGGATKRKLAITESCQNFHGQNDLIIETITLLISDLHKMNSQLREHLLGLIRSTFEYPITRSSGPHLVLNNITTVTVAVSQFPGTLPADVDLPPHLIGLILPLLNLSAKEFCRHNFNRM